MIDLLNDEFLNVWTTIEELEQLTPKLEPGEVESDLHAFAAALLEDYQYPVDTQIRGPDGSLLRQVATNDLMSKPNPMEQQYLAFLRASRD